MEIRFWKYEGAGNDFVIIDGRDGRPLPDAETVSRLCNRNRGIGADGLMVLGAEPAYDFRMTYYNSDGSEADMCGNGGRCIALFAYHMGVAGREMLFLGRDGDHSGTVLSQEGGSAQVEISMIPVENYEFGDGAFVLNTGVEHYVEFRHKISAVDVDRLGKEIRENERFAYCGGVNVNFVQEDGPGEISVRTYERGVEAETLACGTGAVASAIAAHLYSQGACNDFVVHTRGGDLRVRFETGDDQRFSAIKLSGPASRVFSGVIEL